MAKSTTNVVEIQEYIERSWDTLSRSWEHLVEAASDPKLGVRDRYPVFVSAQEDLPGLVRRVGQVLPPEELAQIEWKTLPPDIKARPQIEGGIEGHGLLFLPHPYVVPGGRFNEMYGWDSYFINLGLLLSGRVEQARLMVENHLYQVEHYGRVLNANRTYYLTRSQPPFLAQMIGDIYRRTKDRAWLEWALPGALDMHAFWTTEPHLSPETGLSVYCDLGCGPADEVLASEQDEQGLTHYDRILEQLRPLTDLPESESFRLLGYALRDFYDADSDQLTERFYLGDRSMRESGYDPSDRFGRFNVDVVSYNAVDLNSLLYREESEIAWLYRELGDPSEQALWETRASQRADAMRELLWDKNLEMFLDYNVETQARRHYPFGTMFFPLWTGWATPEQAEAVCAQVPKFLRAGGLLTSQTRTGNQWDAPFGWAPLQLAAVEGLLRYGFQDSALAIAEAFTTMVEKEYARTATIVEKYDVERASGEVSEDIAYGYSSNEIGFGWTNAVYLRLKEVLNSMLTER